MGRRAGADRRDVLRHQNPQPEQSDVRHDEQHADGRQQPVRGKEARAEERGGFGTALGAGVGLRKSADGVER